MKKLFKGQNLPYVAHCAAFSLIEMLMALLVASLLLAALAPVMTKKMNENIHISGYGETYKAPADMQCFSYSDSQPEVDISINDVYSVSFLIASAGGGGAGATSVKKVAATPVQISGTTSDTTRTITIDEYMTDVKATLAGGGGGGAGGAGYVSNCPAGTHQFNGNSNVKAFCMTKYNVGEGENNVNPINAAYVPPRYGGRTFWAHDGNAQGQCNDQQCCYRVYALSGEYTTANTPNCTGTGSDASCTRTVCQWAVASNSCYHFTYVPSNVPAANWSLVNDNQWNYLRTIDVSYLGKNGALLCGENTYAGGYRCDRVGNRCFGTYHISCFPSHMLSQDTETNGIPHWINFADGKLTNVGANFFYHAMSARCSLDKTKLTKSYSGAGGAAGAYISELDITGYVKQAGVGGKIEIIAGKGGKGGDGAASKNNAGSDGSSGGISRILIKNKDGGIVYGIRVKGGEGGKAAENITVSGTAAINPNISASRNCEDTTDGVNWKETSCTQNILKGGNGNTVWASSAAANNGGVSPVNSALTGNGAGGSGGTSSYGYNDTVDSVQGNNGQGGLVKITYNNEFAPAPGGGGGGGTIAQIKDVQLGKQTDCTLTIGKGGKGGGIDNNGIDGGSSSIKCSTDVRTFTVAGGKGGKIGISAQSSTTNPTPGKGGEYGDINKSSTTAVKDYNSSKKTILEGINGEDGIYDKVNKQRDRKSVV